MYALKKEEWRERGEYLAERKDRECGNLKGDSFENVIVDETLTARCTEDCVTIVYRLIVRAIAYRVV